MIAFSSKDECEDNAALRTWRTWKKISLEETKKAAEMLLQNVEQQQDSTALDVRNVRL